ncbi:hypothetical protein THC_1148 [Caldimicrobium thiodismutans]|uniref:DUF4416 domain-containing protein n=1 Tax=Caldimicrobium thiodismutans TaxID=1653476 RepID=A0A0U5ARJ4_9BACT|nr:DUF4416 family protein [Caldimicrobium thiodismutans]BAU23521.1 hypothetical protein THC_1148 [Caldimicrobium thiodismutans]
MSHPKKVEPVLFFIALMEREYNSFKRIKDILEKDLGMVLLQSQTFDFSKFTDYYIEEMGSPLWKTFYFFEYLKEPEFLVELKHICYSLERETADLDGKRNLNLDPGYLTLSKVVLATFKDYAHRIYLGRSVFAEVTLIYRSGGFQSLPWTYPDYKEKMTLEYFNRARALYKDRLRAH